MTNRRWGFAVVRCFRVCGVGTDELTVLTRNTSNRSLVVLIDKDRRTRTFRRQPQPIIRLMAYGEIVISIGKVDFFIGIGGQLSRVIPEKSLHFQESPVAHYPHSHNSAEEIPIPSSKSSNL